MPLPPLQGVNGYKDPETTMGNTCPYLLIEYE